MKPFGKESFGDLLIHCDWSRKKRHGSSEVGQTGHHCDGDWQPGTEQRQKRHSLVADKKWGGGGVWTKGLSAQVSLAWAHFTQA